MTKMQIKIIIISVFLLFASASGVVYAASPQQNTVAVQKGLAKLRKALSLEAKENLKHCSDNKTSKCKTKTTHTPVLAQNADNNTTIKRQNLAVNDNTTTNNNEAVKYLKKVVDNATQKAQKKSKPVVLFKKHSTIGKYPAKVVIDNISVSSNTVKVRYSFLKSLKKRKFKYFIGKYLKNKIVAIDIINPVNICRAVKVYTPQKQSIISRVVVACHNEKKPYGFRFFRISIHMQSQPISYSVVNKKGELIVSFKANKNVEHQIKQSHKTKSKMTIKQRVISAKTVSISLKHISRIYSPYPVKQVIYSKESHLQVQVMGNNIFIKVLPIKILLPSGGYSYAYSSVPRDIYIITEQKIYSLNLVPKKIPSITYMLNPVSVSDNAMSKRMPFVNYSPSVMLNTSSYVNTLLSLIKDTYKGVVPTGYIQEPFTSVKKYKQLTIKGEYKFSNGEWTVYAYKITANTKIYLQDSQFLFLIKKPLASVIVKPVLNEGENTMLFLIGGE